MRLTQQESIEHALALLTKHRNALYHAYDAIQSIDNQIRNALDWIENGCADEEHTKLFSTLFAASRMVSPLHDAMQLFPDTELEYSLRHALTLIKGE